MFTATSFVNMRQIPILIVCLAAATILVTASPEATDENSDLVSLYLNVEEENKLVQGLKAGNFRLRIDGENVPFELREPEKPASIAILVEYSEASWQYFRDIVRSMEGFMEAAPPDHWYALASFAHQFRIEVDFTKQTGEISQGFSSMRRPKWNEINTYDAVYKMLDRMGRMDGRRILIFIGSGFDTFSARSLEDVQKEVESNNVVIYSLAAGSLLRGQYEPYLGTSSRMELMQAEAFLQMLADKSGGQAWFPRFESAYPDVMQGVMQNIESQYRLVYPRRVPADGQFHEIEVEAFVIKNDQRKDFEVRVREGWRRGS